MSLYALLRRPVQPPPVVAALVANFMALWRGRLPVLRAQTRGLPCNCKRSRDEEGFNACRDDAHLTLWSGAPVRAPDLSPALDVLDAACTENRSVTRPDNVAAKKKCK